MSQPLTVAVVTGGHAYDVVAFRQLFRRLEGIDAYVQPLDDFASSAKEVRQRYGAVCFYGMYLETPQDEGRPWYEGTPRAALEELGETAQGIVVLHHAILAYRQWPLWKSIVGTTDHGFGYSPDKTVRSQIVRPDHPIVQGLSSWEMVDETYSGPEAGEDSEVLITYDHPKSMKTIAWTRPYRHARVFCYQAGHDDSAYRDPNFQEVLRRGLLWSAGRLG